MRYRSDVNPGPKIVSPSGSDTYYDYIRTKDDHGVDALIRGAAHSIKDELEVAARGCTLEAIIRRASLGDPTAIQPVSDDMFGDVSKAPKSLAEAEMSIIRAKDTFNGLPVELKKRYNNNVYEFMTALDNGSYFNYIKSTAASSGASASLSADEVAALKKMLGGANNG